MKITSFSTLGFLALMPLLSGCFHPRITAVNLQDRKEPEGIPYYLPKPYLIVSKNIRYIPTPTVGLTQTAPIPNSFAPAGTPTAKPPTDGGAGGDGSGGGSKKTNSTSTATSPAKVAEKSTTTGSGGSTADTGKTNATIGGATSGGKVGAAGGGGDTTANQPLDAPAPAGSSQFFGPASIAVVPSAPLPDGLKPETFYTYQIVYLPDLTQKYGLKVKGGMGEMRATLNIVNGWMFTGPGPVYFHDSSTAETVTAYGNAASGFLDSAASFVSSIYGIPSLGGTKTPKSANTLQGENDGIKDYAELWVYEPNVVLDPTCVGGKRIEWKLLTTTGSNPTVSMNRYVAPASSENPERNGDTPDAPAPADAAPGITKAAGQAIHDLKIDNLTASRTTKSGDNFIVVLSRPITEQEKQDLLAKLKSSGVSDFSTPPK